MAVPDGPAMSVVVLTPDCYETVRKTIHHLRSQAVARDLEIIIVAPSAGALNLDESDRREFCEVRVVEVGAIKSTGAAYAAGVRQASAPVVVLTEEHVYTDPGWAQALIETHQQLWVAVGPAVRNANPGSLTSWASFLMVYGPWSEPVAAGEVESLPKHNSSYKRAVLLAYGPALSGMLQSENRLHSDLRAKGHRLYLEPRAKISHLNFELLSSWLQAQFHSWRQFAAARARGWVPGRRLLYAGGTPLIPFIRLRRLLPLLRTVQQRRTVPSGSLPILMLGLVAGAAGELAGYALGAGDAERKASQFEFHRVRHLAKTNRQAMASS
jgi:hypothetical protein